MTIDEKNRIIQMRKDGLGYGKIAQEMGISRNTIKSFCQRNELTGAAASMPEITVTDSLEEKPCLNCGQPVRQNPGRKEKKFCCDACRNKWWNSHLSQVKRKAMYEFVCPACGKPFTAYGNRNRKYCSHECYIEGRFGGAVCD